MTQALLSVVLPGVSGATQLPESGDIIAVTDRSIRPIASSMPPEPSSGVETSPASDNEDGSDTSLLRAIGEDDGPESYMWLWRLRKVDEFVRDKAVLLARRQCYSSDELRTAWETCVEISQQEGGATEQDFIGFDKKVIDAHLAGCTVGETTPPDVLPQSQQLKIGACLTAHNEQYVLVTWNRHGILGGMGVIDRLDTATGEVVCVAKLYDVWKSVSDPRNGRVYCSTCYDGFTVSVISGSTVLEPSSAMHDQNLVLANMGPAFDFDPELLGGALVSLAHDGGSILVAVPELTDEIRQQLLCCGAEAHESPLDPKYPPGDKSKPWFVWKCPCLLPSHGSQMPISSSFDSVATHWASMAFACSSGRISCVDFQTHTVRSGGPLLTDSSSGGSVVSANGVRAEEHKLVTVVGLPLPCHSHQPAFVFGTG